jgi:hypothetical protein
LPHLFIAAVLLLAGPAQAVDYVKCEAMTNAYNRVRGSKLELMRSLTNDQLAILKASLSKREPKNEPEYVTEVWKYMAREELILSDYNKAKCP